METLKTFYESGVFSAISVVATIIIVFITFFANRNLQRISSYSNKQADRKIVEDIHHLQEESFRAFMVMGDCNDLRKMTHLLRGRDKARLYGLIDIEKHLDKIYKCYGSGYELYYKIWFQNGDYTTTHTAENMNDYHECVKKVYSYFAEDECYKDFLKIAKK